MLARTWYLLCAGFPVVAGMVGLILQVDIGMEDLTHGGPSGALSSHDGPKNVKF